MPLPNQGHRMGNPKLTASHTVAQTAAAIAHAAAAAGTESGTVMAAAAAAAFAAGSSSGGGGGGAGAATAGGRAARPSFSLGANHRFASMSLLASLGYNTNPFASSGGAGGGQRSGGSSGIAAGSTGTDSSAGAAVGGQGVPAIRFKKLAKIGEGSFGVVHYFSPWSFLPFFPTTTWKALSLRRTALRALA